MVSEFERLGMARAVEKKVTQRIAAKKEHLVFRPGGKKMPRALCGEPLGGKMICRYPTQVTCEDCMRRVLEISALDTYQEVRQALGEHVDEIIPDTAESYYETACEQKIVCPKTGNPIPKVTRRLEKNLAQIEQLRGDE